MPGLSGMLSTARRGLTASRIAMEVTSHNIANATTLGYTRQRADQSASMALMNGQGLFIGTGVNVDSINRLRDRLVDSQYRQANGSFGSANMRFNMLSQIESVLSEPSDSGLHSAMTKFFNSFQDLSAHPEDPGPRNAVIQQATNMVQTFNRLSSNFNTQRSNLIEDVQNKVTQINGLTRQIGELNQQIVTAHGAGGQPNDLMDARDRAIDQLSQLTGITASQDSNGAMLVSMGGVLVAGNGTSVQLQSALNGNAVKLTSTDGVDVTIPGGELGGMLEMYNTTIPGYQSQLDSLATTLIDRVNAVHSAGYGLGNPPSTGLNFFTGNSASTIGINLQVSSNTNNIAASGNGQPGNNTNALALFGVSDEQLMAGNTLTFSQYYGRFVSSLGSAVASAKATAMGADLVLSQSENQRDAISGVSLDEEMTNLIKYQRSFEAAARLVNTTNELFQTVLNMV
jgi:flagellar hook-associated protein 1